MTSSSSVRQRVIRQHGNPDIADDPVRREDDLHPSGAHDPEGKKLYPKDPPQLVIGGHPAVNYVATASVGYPVDLMNKVRKASTTGPDLPPHPLPCPKGWLYDDKDTVKIAKQAIETGMFSQYELEDGGYKFQHNPKQYKPVREYVKLQERFAHLTEQHIAKMQAFITAKTKAPESRSRLASSAQGAGVSTKTAEFGTSGEEHRRRACVPPRLIKKWMRNGDKTDILWP